MRLIGVRAGVARLEHEGHRFDLALADLATPDAGVLASPVLTCLDGDGYTCRAVWPLAGEADAQRVWARYTQATAPDAPSYGTAVHRLILRLRAMQAAVRIAADADQD